MQGPVQRVRVGDLGGAVITPVISPLPTAMALIGAALSGHGGPAGLREALLAHLRRRDIEALLPLRTGVRPDGSGGRPNEIGSLSRNALFDEGLDAVRAVDPDTFAQGIVEATNAGHPTGPWRQVADDPARWLAAYNDALWGAWRVIEPIWSRSADVLDREVERISVALARGAGSELIAQVFPSSAVVDNELLLPSHSGESGQAQVGEALRLYPMVAPPAGSGWTDDYGDVWLAVRYSVPAVGRVFGGEQPAPELLSALLGPQRAKILARLDRPVTAGALAEMLQGKASLASYHLSALEKAGLITRTRQGQHVWVRRSARGSQLVAIYDHS